jgi:hypothetical protein
MAVFRDVAACSLVDTDRRFRGAYCLQYQGAASQKTAIFMLVAMKTSNLTIMDAVCVKRVCLLVKSLISTRTSICCRFGPIWAAGHCHYKYPGQACVTVHSSRAVLDEIWIQVNYSYIAGTHALTHVSAKST